VRALAAALLAAALTAAPAAAQDPAPAGAPNPPTRGPADAVLTIVEFTDFECPYCRGALPVIDSLLTRHPADVRIVHRHYPLPMHAHARQAAIAAVEAERQGAFWPYHDLLFAHQDRLADADLVGYADSLGLDSEAFARAISRGTHADVVDADEALGRALAVSGTPTFFVNGYKLVGVPPLWVWEESIKAFREGRARPRPLEPPAPGE